MKKFTKLESGKYITEGINTIKEFNSMKDKLEKDLERVAELANKADTFTLPEVDIISRVVIEEKIDQYTLADDVRAITPFSTKVDVTRKSYKEVEVKRVEDTLVYTLMQDDLKAVGKADLNMFSYMDAVEIAKSRAIIELEELKIARIAPDAIVDKSMSLILVKGCVR